MKGFGKMYRFEFKKLFLKRKSLVFLLLIFIFTIVSNGTAWYMLNHVLPQMAQNMPERPPAAEYTVGEELEFRKEALEASEDNLEKNPKGQGVRANYENARNQLASFKYQLDRGLIKADETYSASNNMEESENYAWRSFMSGDGFSIIWAFAASVLAMSAAGEAEKGTLKSLLVRPVSRGAVLASKFLVALFFLFLLQIMNWAVHVLSAMAFFGAGNPGEIYVFAVMGSAFGLPLWSANLFLLLVKFISGILPMALCLLLAVLLRSSSATITLSLIIVLIINSLLTQLGSFLSWLRFTPFLNMNLSSYLTGPVLTDGSNFLFSLIAATLYLALTLFFAFFIFQKRDA